VAGYLAAVDVQDLADNDAWRDSIDPDAAGGVPNSE
jgi:hypothetical protein